MSNIEKYPAFSVLMSVYKNERPDYLLHSLESIQNQTVKPYEVILVQDGPISDSLNTVIEIVEKKYKNLVNVKLTNNVGLGAALREGTKFITTNLVARMDSDDISLTNRFELQLNKLCKSPELAIVGGQVAEFKNDDINTIVGKRKVPQNDRDIKKFLKYRSPFNHPTVMIRKEVLEKVGGYKEIGNLEDYYLWARILSSGFKGNNLAETLVLMRVDTGLYERRGGRKYLNDYYMLRRRLRRMKIINVCEQLQGNVIMTINATMPTKIRAYIYKKILHR